MEDSESQEQRWTLLASEESRACINPIRRLREDQFLDPIKQSKKELYDVAYGDPAKFGNLPPHPAAREAIKAAMDCDVAGYGHSLGLESARKAVAEAFSTDEHPLAHNDVVMTVGTAGAMDLSIGTLCNRGQNILLPKPGYTLYRSFIDPRGIEARYFNMLPERNWEVDLEDLERQIDGNTAAILVNNPSNPCGSVFSKQHIADILAVAERHKIPIIADEVYAWMVFKGQEFHLFGSVSKNVPVLSCGSISKRFRVPGWRCGWLIYYDKQGFLNEHIKPGIFRLSQRILTPSLLVQASIPDMLKNVPVSFFTETMEFFESNAKLCFTKLSTVPGIKPIMPTATMYIMLNLEMEHFPEFQNEVDLLKQLIVEQGVVCLPGTIFNYPNAIRIALIMPQDKLIIACSRIAEFFNEHYKQ